MKQDVYSRVTDRIIAQLEKGVRPWHQPWSADNAAGRITLPLRHNGEAYRGMNILMLWAEAAEKGYEAPVWMTFRQAMELGGHVRKDEHGSMVVYANSLRKTDLNEKTGEEEEREIFYMKSHTVFNVAQIEGLPARFYAVPEAPKHEPPARIAHIERYLNHIGATVRHGGSRAYYAPGSDHIQMPPFESFEDAESYYAVRLHESVHWTRHPSRLDRDFGRRKWGDEGYAMEELVAEIGSAFVSASLDLTPEVREDHAAYIESWLKVLKNDKRAIFSAAAHAQRAAGYLHDLQPQPAPEPKAGGPQGEVSGYTAPEPS